MAKKFYAVRNGRVPGVEVYKRLIGPKLARAKLFTSRSCMQLSLYMLA
jgi:hypothetical protein